MKFQNTGHNICFPRKVKKGSNEFLIFPAVLVSFIFFILISSQTAFAFDDERFWILDGFAPDNGRAGSGATNPFVIYDENLEGNGEFEEQITVQVESKNLSDESLEKLDVVLTEKNDEGLFSIEHVLYMLEDLEFDITDTVSIIIVDNCDEGSAGSDKDGNCDSDTIETLSGGLGQSVIVYSDSDPVGFPIDLVETGPDTGIFTGNVSFSSSSDSAKSVLHVTEGDVFTIEDQKTNALTNGLISGDPKRIAILTEVFGTVYVTATPSNSSIPITDSSEVDEGSPGGRGSGGFPHPGLVIDSKPSTGDGSGCSKCTPPTLGVDKNNYRLVENGFSYNENPVDVELYYTPYPLVTVNVGEENKVVLKIFENDGPDNIEHVGIGFGLGVGQSFSESKATINIDRTRSGENLISTYDPEGVFENIRVDSEVEKCGVLLETQCMVFTIYHTFREPLNFNMIATYVWDFDGNAWQNHYNHGIHIIGDSLNPPKTKAVAFGSKEMRGLFTLTQIDKFEDKWVDEFGNVYLYKGNDRFDKILSIPKEQIYDHFTMHGCDRLCNWFDAYKLNQEFLAEIKLKEILGGIEIEGDQATFTPHAPYSKVPRSQDVFLQDKIMEEQHKAKELVGMLFDVRNNF